MASINTIPNEFFYQNGIGGNDFSSDTYKVVFLSSGFTFDKNTHGTYSDISGEEITSNGGYPVGGYTLNTNSAWTQNNTDNNAQITWEEVIITASGGAFDTFCATAVYNDTNGVKVLVGCTEFGEDITIEDGKSFVVQDLGFNSAAKVV